MAQFSLSVVIKALNRAIVRVAGPVLKLMTKVHKDKLSFFSSPEDYCDNSRALSEYMVSNGYAEKYKILFFVSDPDKCRASFPDAGVTFVKLRHRNGEIRLGALKQMYQSRVLLTTHGFPLLKKDAHKDQLFIRLWHGCSFKDKTDVERNVKTLSFDYALVPGQLFVKTKAYFWNAPEEKILPLGYPRYDWLLSDDASAAALADSYRTNSDTKVIMWMPTYRNDKKNVYNETACISNFPLIGSDEDWYALDKACHDGNAVLLIKLHPMQKDYPIPSDKFTNIRQISSKEFDKAGVPMYKFIAKTDALISDYSSISVDYLVVDKPMAFTLDDFEIYRQKRGFVFEDPREYMPGHHMYCLDDMFAFIRDLSEDRDEYKDKRASMRTVAVTPSSSYSKDILRHFNI